MKTVDVDVSHYPVGAERAEAVQAAIRQYPGARLRVITGMGRDFITIAPSPWSLAYDRLSDSDTSEMSERGVAAWLAPMELVADSMKLDLAYMPDDEGLSVVREDGLTVRLVIDCGRVVEVLCQAVVCRRVDDLVEIILPPKTEWER